MADPEDDAASRLRVGGWLTPRQRRESPTGPPQRDPFGLHARNASGHRPGAPDGGPSRAAGPPTVAADAGATGTGGAATTWNQAAPTQPLPRLAASGGTAPGVGAAPGVGDTPDARTASGAASGAATRTTTGTDTAFTAPAAPGAVPPGAAPPGTVPAAGAPARPDGDSADGKARKGMSIADLPPVSVRGLPMFLAALLVLGAIAIVAMLASAPSGKSSHTPGQPGTQPVQVVPTLGIGVPTQTAALPSDGVSAGPTSPAPSTTATSARPSAPPTGPTMVGALGQAEFSSYCASQSAGPAALTKPAEGTNAAIDNWACTRQGRVRSFIINPVVVCQARYGSTATARYLNPDDAYSWRCYR